MLSAAIYTALATAMFFLQDAYFSVGGMELSLKNPCAVGIVALALLDLIVSVRLDRLLVLTRHALVQALPFLIPLVFSAAVWVSSGAESAAVVNGVSMIAPQLLSVAVAAATLYLFGERGIWYCLGSMCAANLLSVLVVIQEGGLSQFLQEFCTLLITFSGETGPLMMRLESHDITFAFGPFLIYLLLNWKRIPRAPVWLALTALFFLIGLKRIAVPAVALGFAAAALLGLLPEKAARQAAMCAAVGMMIVSFVYIASIRYGLFRFLEERFQIDTMGRVEMYENLEPYYDITFPYMGRGTGFERFVDWASGAVYPVPDPTRMPIHNDFLRLYLNLGFVGYWVWLWGWLAARLRYWFRQGGRESGCLFLGICVYCFVLYATDNTIYYPYTLIACALVPMACGLDGQARAALEERCAQWSRRGGEAPPVKGGPEEGGGAA